jgi:hypothetical protein
LNRHHSGFLELVIKLNLIRTFSFLLGWLLLQPSLTASQFVYIVDTSGSMRSLWKDSNVVATVAQDIDRALSGTSPGVQNGDQLHIWSFDLKVQEELKVEFQSGSTAEIRRKIGNALDRLKVNFWGKTSLAKPLINVLEQFTPPGSGSLNLFLYTDGKTTIAERDTDSILRLYNHDFRTSKRLPQFFIYKFGDSSLPDETLRLIDTIGGQVVPPGFAPRAPALTKEKPAPEPAPASVASPAQTAIQVLPEAIHFAGPTAPEIVKLIPLQFKLLPPVSGLSVALNLLTTNLPPGMTITTAADRLATEGKQSVSFVIRNPQPGHFSAKLKLSSTVSVTPGIIPVDIDILPATPDNVGIQFFPEQASLISLPTTSRWQPLPMVGVSFFYPEHLRGTAVRFESTLPDGVAIRMHPGDSPGAVISPGALFKLESVGTVAGFEILSTSPAMIDQPFEARLSVSLQPGQNVSSVGTNSLTIPIRFVSSAEVEVRTSEISLGEIPRSTDRVKRTLVLNVQGQTDGSKLLIVKQGQGLAGIEIRPSEITLETGTRSIDLEFEGFSDRPPGPLEGVFVMIPERPNPALYVPVTPITVRGTIAQPSKLIVEIDNPMVAGQSLTIHARFDSGERGAIRALITLPKSGKTEQLELVDSGSAENGDTKADDGIYSAIFTGTDRLGLYQIEVIGTDTQAKLRKSQINVPIYFQASSAPLHGSLSHRRPDQSIEFRPTLVSDYPGPITLEIAQDPDGTPLSTYLSSKRLEPGTNSTGLLLRLTPETGPGNYQLNLHLVTEPIGSRRARIPVTITLKVESLFGYFIKLIVVAVAIGCLVTAGMIIPWDRVQWIQRLRDQKHPRLNPPRRFDERE